MYPMQFMQIFWQCFLCSTAHNERLNQIYIVAHRWKRCVIQANLSLVSNLKGRPSISIDKSTLSADTMLGKIKHGLRRGSPT